MPVYGTGHRRSSTDADALTNQAGAWPYLAACGTTTSAWGRSHHRPHLIDVRETGPALNINVRAVRGKYPRVYLYETRT